MIQYLNKSISPTLGLASVLMLRPISPELVLSPDFWISNIPRYFCFFFFAPIPLSKQWKKKNKKKGDKGDILCRIHCEVGPTLGFNLQFSFGQRWLAMHNHQHFAHPKNVGTTCCTNVGPTCCINDGPTYWANVGSLVNKWKLLTIFFFNFHFLNCPHAVPHVIYLSF